MLMESKLIGAHCNHRS